MQYSQLVILAFIRYFLIELNMICKDFACIVMQDCKFLASRLKSKQAGAVLGQAQPKMGMGRLIGV